MAVMHAIAWALAALAALFLLCLALGVGLDFRNAWRERRGLCHHGHRPRQCPRDPCINHRSEDDVQSNHRYAAATGGPLPSRPLEAVVPARAL
jgi:hypothetical protein